MKRSGVAGIPLPAGVGSACAIAAKFGGELTDRAEMRHFAGAQQRRLHRGSGRDATARDGFTEGKPIDRLVDAGGHDVSITGARAQAGSFGLTGTVNVPALIAARFVSIFATTSDGTSEAVKTISLPPAFMKLKGL